MNEPILWGQFLLEVTGLTEGTYPQDSVCCSGQPGKTKQNTTKFILANERSQTSEPEFCSSAKGQVQGRMGDEARGQELWRLVTDKEAKCQKDQEEKIK